ncbi:hypothetical protein [Hyphomicrobium sp. GJ21]|jgi:hypothetical protein|uniref:hypothetical protein n=1 Tax=Hyphomicrobium sp. GJ21 TaxID=113574 RepID=UPI00062B56FF|nr:hypothetical protein [Hyphomicrobium sp. GJ21]
MSAGRRFQRTSRLRDRARIANHNIVVGGKNEPNTRADDGMIVNEEKVHDCAFHEPHVDF